MYGIFSKHALNKYSFKRMKKTPKQKQSLAGFDPVTQNRFLSNISSRHMPSVSRQMPSVCVPLVEEGFVLGKPS